MSKNTRKNNNKPRATHLEDGPAARKNVVKVLRVVQPLSGDGAGIARLGVVADAHGAVLNFEVIAVPERERRDRGERKRDRERQTDRERERETNRERETERERERETNRETDAERETDRERFESSVCMNIYK